MIYRNKEEYGKKHERKEKGIEEKESYKWIESLEPTAAVRVHLPETKVIHVMDREGDIYEVFAGAKKLEQAVLVRAAWNRGVEPQEKYLWPCLESQPVIGEVTVQVPRNDNHEAHKALLSVRYGKVKIKPPAYRKSEGLEVKELYAVLTREEKGAVGKGIE